MFIAHYENTMRGARPKVKMVAEPRPRSIAEIREEKRAANEKALREMADASRAKAERAKRELEAIASYRCVVETGNGSSAKRIIQMVALAHGVRVSDILGRRRDKLVYAARQDAVKAVAEARPDLSLPQIGRIFDRDHTTILNSLRKSGARRAAA